MGVFSVEIQVGDPQAKSFESVDALVDTGATNTVLPSSLLGRLGVDPYSKSTFELADGSQLDLDIGRTWVKLDGKQEFTQIVFGKDEGGAILGAITLEEMGLAVDPVRRRLVPVNKLLKLAQAKSVEIPEEFLELLAGSRLSSVDDDQRVKAALALHLFVTGEVSAGKAAELIELSRFQFEQLLGELGIPLVTYGMAEFEQDKAAIQLIKRRRKSA